MIKSGDIWLIDFEPTKGSEQAGRRPGVVISGNAMNDHFNISIACPLTSSIKRMAGAVILHPDSDNNLSSKSEVLALHVRSVSHNRFHKKIGFIDPISVKSIIDNLNSILKY